MTKQEKKEWKLTDEEIANIRQAKVMPAVTMGDVEEGLKFFMEDAAKAQAKKIYKELKIRHQWAQGIVIVGFKEEEWQALLKEMEDD